MGNRSLTSLRLIGGTPLVRLNRLPQAFGCQAEILAKLESFNPSASVKDRIAGAMVEVAAGRHDHRTRTNGAGGAHQWQHRHCPGDGGCRPPGYRLILTMPDTMSTERRAMLRAYGAELQLTRRCPGHEWGHRAGPELVDEIPNAYLLQQFDNRQSSRA